MTPEEVAHAEAPAGVAADTTRPWTLDDAKRQAEQAYLKWLDVTEGRKTAEIVAAAVAKERAAVVAWLRGARLEELADAIERGEHRREEGA